MARELPTLERLRELFILDPNTGRLTRRIQAGTYGGKPGSAVGHYSEGYLQVSVDNRMIAVHRIVFAIHHGRWAVEQIDHINGIRDDNRPENLRECSRQQNSTNRKLNANNKSGHKGVLWVPSEGKWQANISHNRRRYTLGRFKNIEDAIAAREQAVAMYQGEFARRTP